MGAISHLSPEDRRKVGVLTVLILVALLFIGHTLFGSVLAKPAKTTAKPAAAPTAPTNSAATAASLVTVTPAQASSELPVSGSLYNNGMKSGRMKLHDPFIQLAGSKSSAPAPTHSAPPSPKYPTGPVMSPLLPGVNGAGGSNIGIVPVAPPSPVITLVGTMLGNPSVASLQVNAVSQNAQNGDWLKGGYQVIQIGMDGITLKHKNHTILLPVGATLNKPQPTNNEIAPANSVGSAPTP